MIYCLSYCVKTVFHVIIIKSFDIICSRSRWGLEVLFHSYEFWPLLFLAVKRKKRKMGMYNLVPKKKAKALKQQEKAGAF